MKSVLVLDAGQRSALAVARSLGKQGVPVYTAEETSPALASCSRYAKQHFQYPSPRIYPERFLEVLVELAGEHHIDMLLPMTELTTSLLVSHADRFPDAIMPFPGMPTIDSIADKCSLMRMADELDIPIPRTWFVDNTHAPPCSPDEISYPAVLKPGKSWLLQNGHWCRSAVRFASDALELREILGKDPAFRTHPFMIQECVSGHGQGIFALYNAGEPFAFFAHRRLREKPPSGGVSVLSESIPPDPVLQSYTRALLDKAGWHGVAMAEYKVTADGTPYLMEINTRFWGSLQLAVDAGVDFPWLLYQLAFGDNPGPVHTYKRGVRLRWLLGDLDSLYLILRDRQFSFAEKAGAFGRFLTPSPFRTRHEVNRLGDLRPFLCELREYINDLLS
jgi:predicted ATP-grasp superfamily ATP-dependent carboligase